MIIVKKNIIDSLNLPSSELERIHEQNRLELEQKELEELNQLEIQLRTFTTVI